MEGRNTGDSTDADEYMLYGIGKANTNEEGVRKLLKMVKERNVRDSTTILSWQIENGKAASQPSGSAGRKDD